MECFQCHKEIDESKTYEITAPDGDIFHTECLKKYEKERDHFFSDIIYNYTKYYEWMGL
jgi:hypothetical protein